MVQTLETNQQALVARECSLDPTDDQLTRLLSQFPENRLSKLMRDVSFVPRNDDCVDMLSNLDPSCRNAVMARVSWEPTLMWIVDQVEKLNRAEMEKIADVLSVKVQLPSEAITNSLRYLSGDIKARLLRKEFISNTLFQ